ncbi:hypothetical protein PMAYCL1PPCAC_29844 [Pristionchus mayeri]|uniref:C2H2-type domain-containing protein n=1 Tax=Pristionchus mayeri TaxID=1317129 RepID=A0AAN5DD37_9BILA|nr:hypothetical protein PMAYCL1PPCAC_29844 [Pristionchus mayeri]
MSTEHIWMMNSELQRFAWHAYSSARMLRSLPRDTPAAKRLLDALNAVTRPHLSVRGSAAIDDLLTYQGLLESQYELRFLVRIIAEVNSVLRRGDNEEAIALLSLASTLVANMERLQEKVIFHYRSTVRRAMEMGQLMVERREESMPTPLPLMRTGDKGTPSEHCIPSMRTPRYSENIFVDDKLPELLLIDNTVKEEPMESLHPPVTSHMVLRKRKIMPSLDYDDLPSTSKSTSKSDDGFGDVENETMESREASPTSSHSGNGIDSNRTDDHSLVGVVSKTLALELAVPWEGMGKVDEESNIGQPSGKSCPFCSQILIGKRWSITRHVKDAHKDLWPEFAQLKCSVPECDYRATSALTMKAHENVYHSVEWKKWGRQGWFHLPNDCHCPFCPNERRRRLKNLGEYRKHVEENHFWDVAMKRRVLECRECRLSYQYTNELFGHWTRSSCSSGVSLIDNNKPSRI